MKYYQHKKTGMVIGIFDELLDPVKHNGERAGGCFTRVVIPEKQIGNGVKYHIMHYSEISGNFKRISVKKAYELFPDFGQFRHFDDNTVENYNLSVEKRKKAFGVRYSQERKTWYNPEGVDVDYKVGIGWVEK